VWKRGTSPTRSPGEIRWPIQESNTPSNSRNNYISDLQAASVGFARDEPRGMQVEKQFRGHLRTKGSAIQLIAVAAAAPILIRRLPRDLKPQNHSRLLLLRILVVSNCRSPLSCIYLSNLAAHLCLHRQSAGVGWNKFRAGAESPFRALIDHRRPFKGMPCAPRSISFHTTNLGAW
jgi:hypothetical protein